MASANGGIIGKDNIPVDNGQAENISTFNASGTLTTGSQTTSVEYLVIAGGGGGWIGTEVKYDDSTSSPFTYIDKYTAVTSDLDLDGTNSGLSTSYVVSVVPNITITNGVGVTVGTGKTLVIDVLKIGDL